MTTAKCTITGCLAVAVWHLHCQTLSETVCPKHVHTRLSHMESTGVNRAILVRRIR